MIGSEVLCYLQLPVVRSGSLQPSLPSTSSSVLSPCTSSQLAGPTQSDPLKIIPHGHVPRGKLHSRVNMSKLLVSSICMIDCSNVSVQHKIVGKLFIDLEMYA